MITNTVISHISTLCGMFWKQLSAC